METLNKTVFPVLIPVSVSYRTSNKYLLNKLNKLTSANNVIVGHTYQIQTTCLKQKPYSHVQSKSTISVSIS